MERWRDVPFVKSGHVQVGVTLLKIEDTTGNSCFALKIGVVSHLRLPVLV